MQRAGQSSQPHTQHCINYCGAVYSDIALTNDRIQFHFIVV